MATNKKVILTGGTGLLALNWALLARNRYEITLSLHERELSLDGVKTKKISLESVDSIRSSFDRITPNLVVHTAGLTNVDQCEANPEIAKHININLSKNLAVACAKHGIPLVHISTDHLFSGTKQMLSEDSTTEPINVYAQTKSLAEECVLEENPDALVVRTNFYGWGPSYRQSFSDVILYALNNGNQITLFEDVFYTPIIIEVLVNIVHELVDAKANGIFHVVGDERISKYNFGLKLAEKFQLDSKFIVPGNLSDKKMLASRPKDMSLSNEKVSNYLGKNIGGVEEHLNILLQQQDSGYLQEIKKI